MARKCAVCGSNADTLMQTANTVNNCVLCNDCYRKIKSFNYRETFESLQSIQQKEDEVIHELEELNYPDAVIEAFRQFYENKKEPYQFLASASLVTTTPSFEGYRITAYHGLVSGKVTLGAGFISSIDADIATTFGGESSIYTDKLSMCETEAVRRALIQTGKVGGNAIVGAKIDYETFNTNLMYVVVTGTAVTIEPIES